MQYKSISNNPKCGLSKRESHRDFFLVIYILLSLLKKDVVDEWIISIVFLRM